MPTYYVDSENGEDSNDGLSIGEAFETLAELETAALAAGDGVRIGLVQGSRWREDLDLSTLDGGVIFAAGDGSAAKPQIDGSKIVANASWTLTDGETEVYEFTDTQVPGEAYLQVWEDGITLQWVANQAAVAGTPGSYTVVGPTAADGKSADGEQVFLIHASDSSNVTSNGKVYEVTDPARNGQLFLGENWTVRNLWTRRNAHPNGSLEAGFGARVYNCTFSEGVKHEVLLNGGLYQDCYGWHPASDVRTNNIVLEFYSADGSGVDCTYRRCAVRGPGGDSAQSVSAFSGHNQGAGTYFENLYAYDCSSEECTYGISFDLNNIRIERFSAVNATIGIDAIGRESNPTVIDCSTHNSTVPLFHAVTGSGPSNGAIAISGLRCYVNDLDANRGIVYAVKVNLTRSAVYFASMPSNFHLVYGTVDGSDIAYSGVAVRNASGQDRFVNVEWYAGTVGFATSLNAYSPNVIAVIDGVQSSTTAAYFAAVQPGDETGSLSADPEFTDPENGDWTIENASVSALPAGLERPVIEYTVVPSAASIQAADWEPSRSVGSRMRLGLGIGL